MVTVDPAQLEGYAAQLERNAGYLGSPLAAYCTAYCARTDGMTGLLAAARPVVELARDSTADLLGSAEWALLQVAVNLRAAAAGYRAGDTAAAERVWRLLPDRVAPPRPDTRQAGDFRDPFMPVLAAPVVRDEVAAIAAEARHQIGVVDEWLARYLHTTLGEHVLPWLVGDWDVLRSDAAAYAELAGPDGLPVIRANLADGMDSLAASWDSPAATRFADTIRERWLPALDALRNVADLHKEALECLAQQSENTLRAVVLVVETLKFWVIEKVLRMVRLAATVVGVGALWTEVMEIATEVVKAWHTIRSLFEALTAAFDAAREWAGLAGAEAAVLDDVAGGRLAPLTGG